MNATTAPTPSAPILRDDRNTRFAWGCVIAAPGAFVIAFVAAEATSALLGYDGGLPGSWSVALVSLLVGVAIFSLPAAFAVWFWRRAHRRGDDRAKVPALILVVLSVAFLGVNLLSGILTAITEGG
jgi:hypothetical protein